MKFLLACVLHAVVIFVAFGLNWEHCEKNDLEIRTLLDCVESKVPFYLKAKLNETVKKLGCTEKLCAVRKVCGQADVEETLQQHFPAAEVGMLKRMASRCERLGNLVYPGGDP
ncbi:antimicrobial peptide microplusin-like [Ixodes scapularis]|uniref:antimicrobial peptide microplusin-like n=1 Tax=Ixodes scapularis TaxID=6945 RepID=UPI001C38EEE1|nr:antimicrobial peptide microplusin-like [Ixodes scapularis]